MCGIRALSHVAVPASIRWNISTYFLTTSPALMRNDYVTSVVETWGSWDCEIYGELTYRARRFQFISQPGSRDMCILDLQPLGSRMVRASKVIPSGVNGVYFKLSYMTRKFRTVSDMHLSSCEFLFRCSRSKNFCWRLCQIFSNNPTSSHFQISTSLCRLPLYPIQNHVNLFVDNSPQACCGKEALCWVA